MLHCFECREVMKLEDEACGACGCVLSAEPKEYEEAINNEDFRRVMAILEECPEIVKRVSVEQGLSLLLLAILGGTAELVEKLINLGADGSAVELGEPLLMWALGAKLEATEKVRSIARKIYTTIDTADSYGYTALFHAASENRLDIIEILLESRANPNFSYKPTPKVPFLIDINSTPMHIAAKRGYFRAYELMKRRGGSEWVRDGDGKTPSDYLDKRINDEIGQEEKRKARRLTSDKVLQALQEGGHDIVLNDEKRKRIEIEWERIRQDIEVMQEAGQLPGIGLLDTPRLDILRRKLQLMRSTMEFRDHILMLEEWVVEKKNRICEYMAGMRLVLATALMLDELAIADLVVDFLEEEQTWMKLFPWRYGLENAEA
jgi:hypothetical protein